MYICQWHLEIPFGKQAEVMEIMKSWLEEGRRASEFRRAARSRLLVGHIGRSASHIIGEHEFQSLADFEAALADMKKPEFKRHAEELAPYIVPGSQHWEILRSID